MMLALLAACSSLMPQAHAHGRRAALSGAAFAASSGAAFAVVAPALAQSDEQFKSVATQVGGDDFVSVGAAGLKYKEVRLGTGEKVRDGDTVSIQFSGRCLNLNGKKFISTQDAAALTTGLAISEPFVFTVGSGGVIAGLDQAVVGMAKDGYRRVVVPQALGYDAALTLQPLPDSFEERRSLESIVKNPNRDASLLFDVKLERIKGGGR